MAAITPAAEADRIISVYGADGTARVMELLERQFALLHNRAQVLLGLCGVVITTTGFSGRIIAGTSRLAQLLIVVGVVLTLASAVTVVRGVLHLHWLTQQPGDFLRPWLLTCLEYRNTKTRAYRMGITLLLLGLAFYVAAIAAMLINPYGFSAPPGR